MSAGAAISLFTLGASLAGLPFLDRQSPRQRALVCILYVLLRLRYAYWQIGCCLAALTHGWVWLPVWAFVAWEIWLTWLSVREWLNWPAMRDRSSEADAHEGWYLARGGRPPLVDVFITTCNEQRELIERCIACALKLDYPNFRIWILDDGRRGWVQELATAHGVRYITRSDNTHYKEGNLNNALNVIMASPTVPEYIAVLDCDFVVMPEFLRRALALMHDPTVGIVQTPQVFYNADTLQHNYRFKKYYPDVLRFTFDFWFPTRDVKDLANCCGTSSVTRVSALKDIGLFATGTLAGDTLTSYAMRERGYKTVYLAEHLSFGIAAEGLQGYLKQQARWCLGTIQNLFTRYGPLRPGPKTLKQLFFGYEDAIIWGVFCSVQWVYIVLSIGLWFFPGFLPMAGVTVEGFVSNYFPMWVFGILAVNWLTGWNRIPFFTESVAVVSTFVICRATWRGVTRSPHRSFDVTDKGAVVNRTFVHWRIMRWLVLAAGLLVVGMYLGLRRPEGLTPVMLFCSGNNLLLLLVSMGLCIEPPQRRREDRFECNVETELVTAGGREPAVLADLCSTGARVKTRRPLRVGDEVRIPLLECGELDAEVTRVGKSECGVVWKLTDDQRLRVIRHVYSRRYIRPTLSGRPLGAIWMALRKVFA